MIQKLVKGWRPDLPDFRDYIFAPKPNIVTKNFPNSLDLRLLKIKFPQVYDQGQLGSCTANAIAAAIEFEQAKQGKTTFTPSRLFIYYNERVMEGSVSFDAGAEIRDGIKSVAKQGVCNEKDWIYDISKFTSKPKTICYTNGLLNQVLKYERVEQTLDLLKACLVSGYPFVFGFSVYDAFESEKVATTGILTYPTNKESLLGGHAVMCVGYDNSKQAFLVRNSWGKDWGLGGYFWMPYRYMTNSNLASDFWKITMVE